MAFPAFQDDKSAGPQDAGRGAIDDAKLLADMAMQIQEADTADKLGTVLVRNLELWAAIKHDMSRHTVLPDGIRRGLIQLADYVTATILRAEHAAMSVEQVQSLVTINLRIAAGLIEGQIRAVMGEDAFRKWDEEGRPMGPDFERWLGGDQAGQASAA